MINGKPILPNIKLFGACNPHRYKIKKAEEIGKLFSGLKRHFYANSNQLNKEYLVNPLSPSLLMYAINFGKLVEENELKYIRKMIANLEILDKYLIAEIIKEIHRFYTCELQELSSVSLRDVKRFTMLFQFFMGNQALLKGLISSNFNFRSNDISIILSILICYYFKLQVIHRPKIIEIISNLMKYKISEINQLKEDVCNNLYEKMVHYPQTKGKFKGIINTTALNENLFLCFICILNLIPLIILGKPGNSKSLSLKIVIEALKGKESDIELFSPFSQSNFKIFSRKLNYYFGKSTRDL